MAGLGALVAPKDDHPYRPDDGTEKRGVDRYLDIGRAEYGVYG
jgi:hypothetical protein